MLTKIIDEIPTFDEFKRNCPIESRISNLIAAFLIIVAAFAIIAMYQNVTVLQ